MNSLVQDIARKSSADLCYSIMNGRVREYPYPHCFLKNIFENESLAALNRYFPREGEMLPLGIATGNPNYQSDNLRAALDVADESQLLRLGADSREYWSKFHFFFTEQSVLRLLLSKYRDAVLKHPFCDVILAPETKLKVWFYLQSDSSQFTIAPHTQDPSEALVILIYLPQQDNSVRSGTTIYVPESGCERPDMGYARAQRDDFVNVRTAPYLINSGMTFVKTLNSWHGVEPLAEDGGRRSIYISLGIEK
jgi:hypothetical protein